jgi:hypothetical protein
VPPIDLHHSDYVLGKGQSKDSNIHLEYQQSWHKFQEEENDLERSKYQQQDEYLSSQIEVSFAQYPDFQ